MGAYSSLTGNRREVRSGERLLTFSAFRMGTYWALIRINAVLDLNLSVFPVSG